MRLSFTVAVPNDSKIAVPNIHKAPTELPVEFTNEGCPPELIEVKFGDGKSYGFKLSDLYRTTVFFLQQHGAPQPRPQ